MNYMDFRTASTARGRDQRRTPPQLKEARKQPLPKERIELPNKSYISLSDFHQLRSNSHKEFESYSGLAELVKAAISNDEWLKLLEWMKPHRAGYRNMSKQNDGFIAVLIDCIAKRRNRAATDVLAEILRDQTANILLNPTRR